MVGGRVAAGGRAAAEGYYFCSTRHFFPPFSLLVIAVLSPHIPPAKGQKQKQKQKPTPSNHERRISRGRRPSTAEARLAHAESRGKYLSDILMVWVLVWPPSRRSRWHGDVSTAVVGVVADRPTADCR